MGIVNPRPAMRRAERHRIEYGIALLEIKKLRALNAELLAALIVAMMAMGSAGANFNTAHPLRPAWEQARAVIAKTERS